MTPACRTIYYFSFYLFAVALTLIFVPNVLLNLLHIPETNEVWIRIAGVLALCIGYYYYRTGYENNISFCRHTVPTRILVFISFTAFVIAGLVSPVLIAFGAVDLAGAIWTWSAFLKKEDYVKMPIRQADRVRH